MEAIKNNNNPKIIQDLLEPTDKQLCNIYTQEEEEEDGWWNAGLDYKHYSVRNMERGILWMDGLMTVFLLVLGFCVSSY